MTCVEKSYLIKSTINQNTRFFFSGGGCLKFGRGALGWGRSRNRGGEGRQSSDIFIFANGITYKLLMSVIPLAISMVNWSRHCTGIPV